MLIKDKIKQLLETQDGEFTQNYILETLTPVHIGSGNEIIRWSYGIFRDKVYIYDFEEIVKNLDRSLLKELTNLIANNSRYVKDLGHFLEQKAPHLVEKKLYAIELKGNISKEIKEFIKVKEDKIKVYIPASEIKGAIRTAVFYYFLKQNQQALNYLINELKKELYNFKSKNRDIYNWVLNGKKDNIQPRKKKILSNLQKNLQKPISDLEKQFFRNWKDAKFDILKYLKISDTSLNKTSAKPENSLIVKNVKIVNASRSFSEPYEIVKPDTTFKFSISIPNNLYQSKLNNTNEFSNLDVLNKLAEICNDSAKDLLEEEKNYWKTNSSLEESRDALEELSYIENRLSNLKKGEFVIRLGMHEGFLSTTIAMAIKHKDLNFYKELYPFLVPRGYSQAPNKTRKLTEDGEPIGWCLIAKDTDYPKNSKNKQNTKNSSNTSKSSPKSWEEAINKLKSSGRFKIKE